MAGPRAGAGHAHLFCPRCGTLLDLPATGATGSCPLCRFQRDRGAAAAAAPDAARGGLPRFFAADLPSSGGGVVAVGGGELWHMARALRLAVGDRVELFDARGALVEAEILSMDKTTAELAAIGSPVTVPWAGPKWHIPAMQPSLRLTMRTSTDRYAEGRPSRLAGGEVHGAVASSPLSTPWQLLGLLISWQELGAAALVPLLTERSPRAAESRIDRWQRVALAAAKQCQRLHGLEISEPVLLEDLMEQVGHANPTLLATAEAKPLLSQVSREAVLSGGLLLIGPEGDFTEKEVSMLLSKGALPVGLGPRRLRVETAAIAMLAALVLKHESDRVVH
eukprot:SM000009S23530  [mRNA]  locus=s9:492458:494796:- [translate_table: standard]